MKNNKELIKVFTDLYNMEKAARDLYNEFLLTLKKPELIKQVKKIRDDEEEHMKIANKIIGIISNE